MGLDGQMKCLKIPHAASHGFGKMTGAAFKPHNCTIAWEGLLVRLKSASRDTTLDSSRSKLPWQLAKADRKLRVIWTRSCALSEQKGVWVRASFVSLPFWRLAKLRESITGKRRLQATCRETKTTWGKEVSEHPRNQHANVHSFARRFLEATYFGMGAKVPRSFSRVVFDTSPLRVCLRATSSE